MPGLLKYNQDNAYAGRRGCKKKWPAIILLVICLAFQGCGSGGGGGSSPDDENNDDPDNNVTYTLSGTVKAAANTAVDSDVNDPNAPYASNDSVIAAQDLYSPVTLGGYVNEPETGNTGRSYQSGDINDIFRANLLAGETIVLAIADSYNLFTGGPDLDLFLYDAASVGLIDSATGVSTRIETIAAPEDGTYIIQVHAAKGASSYTLTIGQPATAAARGGRQLLLSSSFMPYEAVVRLAPATDLNSGENEVSGLNALAQRPGAASREQLFKFQKNDHSPDALSFNTPDSFKSMLIDGASMDRQTREKLETLLQIKQLESRTDVKTAEPNYIRSSMMIPDDTYYNLQWHYPMIHLPAAWNITGGDPGVIVGVIDSGILSGHPDIRTKLSDQGYDFVSDSDRAMDGDGIDSDPEDPGDGSQGGSLFHGTHVAGTIAAKTNNNEGVAGVGGTARIMPLRALGRQSTGTSYDILQAVRYAAGMRNDSGQVPDRPVDILNLSFGGQTFSEAEQNVYSQARNNGVILVASAGNSASDTPFYPAAYDGVISVSAVDINASLAPYSNFGDTIDVAAPGGNLSADLNGDGYGDGILSTSGDDSSGTVRHVYRFFQGTSMAAPHVSGVAALMKALRPSMTPEEFDSFVQSGAILRDIGAQGRDDLFGHGLIDAQRAVLTATGGTAPTLLDASPVRLSLGAFAHTASLSLSRVGTGDLNVTDFFTDASWLEVQAADIDENGLGTYTVTAQRQELSDGIYNGAITFISSENTLEIPVSMRVSSLAADPDAGYHYILLVDHETGQTIDQVSTGGEHGLYQYRFTNVAPGRYRIYAGTDSDNDDIVGDAGEAFGAYLSTDQPREVVADIDLTGLDFPTGFQINLSRESAYQDSPDSVTKRLDTQNMKSVLTK